MERSDLQSTSADKQKNMSFNMSKVSVVTRVKQYKCSFGTTESVRNSVIEGVPNSESYFHTFLCQKWKILTVN